MFVTTIFDIFFVGGGEFYKLKTGIPGCFLGAYSSSIARLTQTLHKSDVSTISVFVRHGKGSDSSVDSSHRPTWTSVSSPIELSRPSVFSRASPVCKMVGDRPISAQHLTFLSSFFAIHLMLLTAGPKQKLDRAHDRRTVVKGLIISGDNNLPQGAVQRHPFGTIMTPPWHHYGTNPVRGTLWHPVGTGEATWVAFVAPQCHHLF